MAKIILIPNPNPCWQDATRQPQTYAPLGLISLATVLRASSFDVTLLDINGMGVGLCPEVLADVIMTGEPDIIGFSTLCSQYLTTLKIARACKDRKSAVKVILGGPQASITDEATMRLIDRKS